MVVEPIQSNRQVSAAGFASLLLGVSLALMLCGSVTFVIGFILMPWVLGIVLVFYLVGVVSALSSFGRAFLYPPPPPKQIPVSGFGLGFMDIFHGIGLDLITSIGFAIGR
ncbi:hypothetical protein C5167_007066 [Papaver somniferum]|uniref:Uncharacterized protein n=1 Tax=Papaver somniferum TaxID=3469 RepID=A0A4Y7JFB9_PAPSO|nr:hypothetical protein C5167_007066 [Papaver somniferum]